MTSATKKDPVDRHIGARLRALRKAAGVSTLGLADDLGTSRQQVEMYEAGKNRIAASRLYRAARALDVPVERFFEGAETAAG